MPSPPKPPQSYPQPPVSTVFTLPNPLTPPYLVSIQGALDQFTDLLKHRCLVGCGTEDLVKAEGVARWSLASEAARHGDVNATAKQLT